MVNAPDPGPRVYGCVVFRLFSETIATEGDAKSAPKLEVPRLEAAVKRVPSVTEFSFDPERREVKIGYSGFAKDIKELKIAIEGQGLSCEAISPARVVVRPLAALEKSDGALSAMKTVSGVVDVAREGNDLIAYSDLAVISLDGLAKALENSGVKCQIPSHEEVKVKYGASGNVESLKAELLKTRWVLRAAVDSDGHSIKVLAVRGRLTRAIVATLMNKYGFRESK